MRSSARGSLTTTACRRILWLCGHFGRVAIIRRRTTRDGLKYICADTQILYHNGAEVNTSFVTNLGEYLIETAPDLSEAVKAANKVNLRAEKKELPKYTFPMEIVTAARCKWYAAHGTVFRVRPEEAVFVRTMDNMAGKTIFGAGFLVGPRAAAERAAAERAAAYVWELSPREREISNGLG